MEDIQLVTCPWCPRAEEPLSSHFIFLQQNMGQSVKEAPAKQRHQWTTQETKRQVCPLEITCKGTGKSSEISSYFQAVSFPTDLTSIMTLVFPPLQDFWASVSNKSSNQSTFQFQLQSGSLNEASRYWAIPSKQAEGKEWEHKSFPCFKTGTPQPLHNQHWTWIQKKLELASIDLHGPSNSKSGFQFPNFGT